MPCAWEDGAGLMHCVLTCTSEGGLIPDPRLIFECLLPLMIRADPLIRATHTLCTYTISPVALRSGMRPAHCTEAAVASTTLFAYSTAAAS